MDINILGFPVPDRAFLALILIGAVMQLARALTAGLDEDLLNCPETQSLPATLKGTAKRLLAGVHHWWIGGLIAYYNAVGYTLNLGLLSYTSPGSFEWLCVGLGLMLDDYDDMPGRLRDILANLKDSISGPASTEKLILPGPGLYQVIIPPPTPTINQPTLSTSSDVKKADGGMGVA